METLLMTCLAAAIIAAAWLSWTAATLKRERDHYYREWLNARELWHSERRWRRRALDRVRELKAREHPLDEALNTGDGSYRP